MPEPEAPDVQIIERDGYLEARYLGTYSIGRYLRQMEWSVQACKDRNLNLHLVDITGLAGYRPTTFEAHRIGALGASLSRSLEKVAALVTAAQLQPDPFATLVAQNRGLKIQIFTDRVEAEEWLLPGKPRG